MTKNQVMNVRISKDDVERICELSKRLKTSRSEAIRTAVSRALETSAVREKSSSDKQA